MIAKLQKFIVALLNPNGLVSFGRFMAMLTTAFVLGWDTAYLVFAWRFNQHLAAGVAPMSLFPDVVTITAQAGFMTLFYGVTKYGDLHPADCKPEAPDSLPAPPAA